MNQLIRAYSLRVLLLVGPLFLVVNVHAQNWTEEEQELLDHMEMAWDAWLEAVKKNNPQIWYDKIKPAENFSMWWTDRGSPRGYRAIERDWDAIRGRNPHWIDMRPVAVRIYDNVGMVQFYGYWKSDTPDGPVTSEYMRTEVFVKRNGHWTFIGGQGTPASAADAEPYK